jgi:hypothetical protein
MASLQNNTSNDSSMCCCEYRRWVDIDPHDGYPESFGNPHGSASGTARHLQHALTRSQAQPPAELVAFRRSDPARLPEIVSKRFDPHGPIDLCLGLSVVTVV